MRNETIIKAIAKRVGYAIASFIIAAPVGLVMEYFSGPEWARPIFVAVFFIQYHELRHHGGLT